MELRNLDEFHRAIGAGNVIVITDDANGNKAHQVGCSWLKDAYFVKKVIKGGAKNGSYFAVATVDEAMRAYGARPCGRCRP